MNSKDKIKFFGEHILLFLLLFATLYMLFISKQLVYGIYCFMLFVGAIILFALLKKRGK